jgi:hypothetical protein
MPSIRKPKMLDKLIAARNSTGLIRSLGCITS